MTETDRSDLEEWQLWERRVRRAFLVITLLALVFVASRDSDSISNCPPTTAVDHDLRAIVNQATMLYATTGRWPRSLADMVLPTDEDDRELPGFEQLPRDPWGRAYRFELIDGKPVAKLDPRSVEDATE